VVDGFRVCDPQAVPLHVRAFSPEFEYVAPAFSIKSETYPKRTVPTNDIPEILERVSDLMSWCRGKTILYDVERCQCGNWALVVRNGTEKESEPLGTDPIAHRWDSGAASGASLASKNLQE